MKGIVITLADDADPCAGLGWLLVAVDGDDTRLRIERCDACGLLASDDEAAALPEAQTALAGARR